MEETPSNGNEHPGNGIVPRNGGGKSRGLPSRGMARWNDLKHGVLSQGAVLPTEWRASTLSLSLHGGRCEGAPKTGAACVLQGF